jgi:nucleoredoxin
MKLPPALLLLVAALALPLRAVTLAEAVADPQLWPAEVTITAMTKATTIKSGQPAGVMLVGVGKKLTVTALAADSVTGKVGGVTVKVAVDQTDLLQRLDPAATPTAEAVAPMAEPAAESEAAPSAMQRRLAGKLVHLAGGALQPLPAGRLNGVKYYGLYYSASWCGPCKQFTPGLAAAYRRLKQKHPEFELVFLSADHSAGDMRAYMQADRMPWPALKYDLVAQSPELMRYGGPGIPCLVLVDATGRVLSDSFAGNNYLGPQKVLADTERILQRGGR